MGKTVDLFMFMGQSNMLMGIELKAPMGWNSWDCYGAAVTEDIVRKNADLCMDEYGRVKSLKKRCK